MECNSTSIIVGETTLFPSLPKSWQWNGISRCPDNQHEATLPHDCPNGDILGGAAQSKSTLGKDVARELAACIRPDIQEMLQAHQEQLSGCFEKLLDHFTSAISIPTGRNCVNKSFIAQDRPTWLTEDHEASADITKYATTAHDTGVAMKSAHKNGIAPSVFIKDELFKTLRQSRKSARKKENAEIGVRGVNSLSSEQGKEPETTKRLKRSQKFRNKISSVLHTDKLETDDLRKRIAADSLQKNVSELEDDDIPLWRRRFRSTVTSPHFELFFAIAICFNAVLIGVELEMTIHSDEEEKLMIKDVFFSIECIYAILFLSEFGLRVTAKGVVFFWSKHNFYWNWFDVFVLVLTLIDIIPSFIDVLSQKTSDADDDISNLQIFRIGRVTRLVRVFRIVRFITALRNLIYSIGCTMKSMMSAMLLLLIVIYVFALMITQTTYNAIERNKVREQHVDTLGQYWGTLAKSMFTLFKAITGGFDWEVAVSPLSDVHWSCVWLFIVFLTFVDFAMLNVMTGVFCQFAIESKQNDQDAIVPEYIQNRRNYIQRVTNLFNDIDSDRAGFITIRELEACLENDYMQARFATLGLDVFDAWSIFKLLDDSGDYMIDCAEFVAGVDRLQGPAKAVDVAMLLHETKLTMGTVLSGVSGVRHLLANFGSGLHNPVDSQDCSRRVKKRLSPNNPQKVDFDVLRPSQITRPLLEDSDLSHPSK